MFTYRLFLEDGSNLGEAVYAQMIKLDEVIWAAGASKFRVVDFVPTTEDSDRYLGFLKVQPIE